ncbi:MAG: acyl-ACP--UDP-N-acetylglucosamine O-acyltransferase [Vampirovibrionales bacterium]
MTPTLTPPATTAPGIHPTAIIDSTATLGDNVSIGPYTVIGPHCVVENDVILGAHVVLDRHVTVGAGTHIYPTAIIGCDPQDMAYKGEVSRVLIGQHCWIREGVTIHRASGEGNETRVGNRCMLMANTHVAHNTVLGNEVIMANGALLGGYVTVGDNAFISAATIVHQFVSIGRLSMLAGASGTRQDIPPFAMTNGRPVSIRGINKVALRRQGFSSEQRHNLQRAYDLIWFSGLTQNEGLLEAESLFGHDPNVMELLNFVKTSKRGIRRHEGRNDIEDADD